MAGQSITGRIVSRFALASGLALTLSLPGCGESYKNGELVTGPTPELDRGRQEMSDYMKSHPQGKAATQVESDMQKFMKKQAGRR